MTDTPTPDSNAPEFPDPALLASIEHQATKLGYLTAQLHNNFRERSMYLRREVLVSHGREGARITRLWIDGKLTDEEYAQATATLSAETSDRLDDIKMNYLDNTEQLQAMVRHHLAMGEDQTMELDNFLDKLLKEEGKEGDEQ